MARAPLVDIPRTVYRCEVRRYVTELEPEVRDWLETLRLTEYAKVEAMADILAERAETLGEPYSRHLGGKTRELRFHLDRSRRPRQLLARTPNPGGAADRVPQVPPGRTCGGHARHRRSADLRTGT